MELLYASRQSASDVPRGRVNLLVEFCSRMHRGGPARCGTPQARIGYFFGAICIGNPTVNSGAPPGVAETGKAHFEIEKFQAVAERHAVSCLVPLGSSTDARTEPGWSWSCSMPLERVLARFQEPVPIYL